MGLPRVRRPPPKWARNRPGRARIWCLACMCAHAGRGAHPSRPPSRSLALPSMSRPAVGPPIQGRGPRWPRSVYTQYENNRLVLSLGEARVCLCHRLTSLVNSNLIEMFNKELFNFNI